MKREKSIEKQSDYRLCNRCYMHWIYLPDQVYKYKDYSKYCEGCIEYIHAIIPYIVGVRENIYHI